MKIELPSFLRALFGAVSAPAPAKPSVKKFASKDEAVQFLSDPQNQDLSSVERIWILYETIMGDLKRKDGQNYRVHVEFVAEPFKENDPELYVIGIGHDLIEEQREKDPQNPLTLNDLYKSGFCERVVLGLHAMDHEEGVGYLDYVRQGSRNPDFIKIKLRDIEHNMDHKGSQKDFETSLYHLLENMTILQNIRFLKDKQKFIYPVCYLYLLHLELKLMQPLAPPSSFSSFLAEYDLVKSPRMFDALQKETQENLVEYRPYPKKEQTAPSQHIDSFWSTPRPA
jgi:hypothetical protein